MALHLQVPQITEEFRPRICVVGVGGAGGNAINNMISSGLEGVEFLVCNTDAQDLSQSLSENRLQLGPTVTKGLGAGMQPAVGAQAAEESIDEILHRLDGANMVFITAGMGGGTGTGAAPVVAKALRDRQILTVGVVTRPFDFEGKKRTAFADEGISNLSSTVDTLIVIPNQNLFRLADQNTTFADAFKMADNVLLDGVRGVSDLIVKPGVVNLDFADVRTLMTVMGKAMMGTGEAEGDNRAIEAAERAIANPLLDDISLDGAQGILINVTGGYDVTLYEVDMVANHIREKVDAEANIIFGSSIDANMEGILRVSVVATGIDAHQTHLGAGILAPQGRGIPGVGPRPGDPTDPGGPGGGMPQHAPRSKPAPGPTAPSQNQFRSPFAFRSNRGNNDASSQGDPGTRMRAASAHAAATPPLATSPYPGAGGSQATAYAPTVSRTPAIDTSPRYQPTQQPAQPAAYAPAQAAVTPRSHAAAGSRPFSPRLNDGAGPTSAMPERPAPADPSPSAGFGAPLPRLFETDQRNPAPSAQTAVPMARPSPAVRDLDAPQGSGLLSDEELSQAETGPRVLNVDDVMSSSLAKFRSDTDKTPSFFKQARN